MLRLESSSMPDELIELRKAIDRAVIQLGKDKTVKASALKNRNWA